MTLANCGSDLSTFAGPGGTVGVDPLFMPIEGPRVALENVARRFMTRRGGIPGFPNDGYDLIELTGKRMNAVARKRAEADIVAEAEKEERVLSAKVTKFVEATPGRYELRIAVMLAEGPFELVLGISDVNVSILKAA